MTLRKNFYNGPFDAPPLGSRVMANMIFRKSDRQPWGYKNLTHKSQQNKRRQCSAAVSVPIIKEDGGQAYRGTHRFKRMARPTAPDKDPYRQCSDHGDQRTIVYLRGTEMVITGTAGTESDFHAQTPLGHSVR